MKKTSNNLAHRDRSRHHPRHIGWLAYSGYGPSKSTTVNMPELVSMGDKAYTSHLRVEGFVKPGSIEQNGTNVTFVLNEFESHSRRRQGPHC